MKYRKLWADMHSNIHHNRMDELNKWLKHAESVMDFWPIAYYPYGMRTTESGFGVEDLIPDEQIQEDWKMIQNICDCANQDGFPMFAGYEWQGNGDDGDHNVFFLKNHEPIRFPMTYPELVDTYKNTEAIGIPHHVAYQLGNRGKNWQTHNESFSPFAEIYSSHGCSENDNGPFPMDQHMHMGPRLSTTCYETGLNMGYKVGCIASGDNHSVPGAAMNGIMCALAKSSSKADIWDALIHSRVYGVSHSRIDVDYSVNGALMGSTTENTGSAEVRFSIKGTGPVDRVEVLKNNVLIDMPVHSGTWEEKKYSGVIRFKVKVEFGWGPLIQVFTDLVKKEWKGSLETEGKILSVEKLWNHMDQTASLVNEHRCDFDMTSWQTTPSGKWMGSVDTVQEGLIFEIEADIDSDIIINANGHRYALKVADLLKDSCILAEEKEAHELIESRYGEVEMYRNDTWWHNAYKIKVSKAYPETAILWNIQRSSPLTKTVSSGCVFGRGMAIAPGPHLYSLEKGYENGQNL